MSAVAILPVKRFSHGKQRLRGELSGAAVEELVQSMFTQALSALGRAGRVERIVVITQDQTASRIAAAQGAAVIADPEQGHNGAAMRGIGHALETGAERALLVPGDCPLLDPGELDELIERPQEPPSVLIVPDRHGSGTNALLLTPPDAIEPSFGPGSRARHQRIAEEHGTSVEVVQVPSLALDIDTPDDLAALSRC